MKTLKDKTFGYLKKTGFSSNFENNYGDEEFFFDLGKYNVRITINFDKIIFSIKLSNSTSFISLEFPTYLEFINDDLDIIEMIIEKTKLELDSYLLDQKIEKAIKEK